MLHLPCIKPCYHGTKSISCRTMLPSSSTSVLAGGRLSCFDLQEHPPRRYCDVLQEKYALHPLEPMMVPCPSSKTLGPATSNFEPQAQITSVSTFTQECPDFLPSWQDYSCSSRYAGIFVRGKLRCKPTLALSSRAPFAGAEAVPGLRSPWAV